MREEGYNISNHWVIIEKLGKMMEEIRVELSRVCCIFSPKVKKLFGKSLRKNAKFHLSPILMKSLKNISLQAFPTLNSGN